LEWLSPLVGCVHYFPFYLIKQVALLIVNPKLSDIKLGFNLAMITCYGEALIDLIVSPYSPNSLRSDSQACLGGSVFNFCVATARQGLATAYLNPLSHDSFGAQFRRLLLAEGVALASPAPSALPTSIAVVQLDAAGKASYAFHREAVADRSLSAAQAIAALPEGTQVLHTGCLMLVPQDWPTTRALMQAASQQGACITVDANLRTVVCPDLLPYRASVLAACALAHVVKVSDDDLVALGADAALVASDPVGAARGVLGREAVGALSAVDRVGALGSAGDSPAGLRSPALIALTLGAAGAWLLTPNAQYFQASPRGIAVADTVGAGDSFFAALLAYLQRQGVLQPHRLVAGMPPRVLQGALAHAVAAAALNVMRVGCNPATWDETVAE
jgi:fructokinase